MSIERGPSEQIEDIEQARAAAEAEKPFRDAAREADAPPEDAVAVDRAAERQGDKAATEYAAEKERQPLERLYRRLESLTEKMEQTGMKDDAGVLQNLRQRLDQYVTTIREEKKDLEEKSGRPISTRTMIDEDSIGREVPITSRWRQQGGEIFTTGESSFQHIRGNLSPVSAKALPKKAGIILTTAFH